MSAAAQAWGEHVAAARCDPRPKAENVTLVVPTIGRTIFAEGLAALLAGTVWPGHVIVVDQGPCEPIRDWLADLRTLGVDARYERCPGRGKALGLNLGLRLVTTPFVVLTDDDCIPEAHWIERFAAHLEASPGVVFTGRVAAAGEERVINVVSDTQSSIVRRPQLSYDRLSGGNCGTSVDVLRKVGLFDEDPCLWHAEDSEWAYRVLKAGVPIVYAPDLIVAHVGWRELDKRLAQYRGYAFSHAAFFGKHLRRGDAFMALRAGVHLLRALRRWQRGAFARDAELAANGRTYAAALVPGIVAGLRSRIRPPGLQ